MKKLKLITILFLFTFTANAQFQLSEDFSFAQDKQYHAIAGAAISATVFTVVYKKTGDESLAMRAGWMSACTAGFVKEFTGAIGGSEISIADLAYTTAAGVAVGYLFKGAVRYKKKRKERKKKELIEFEDTGWSLDNEFINNLNR